MKIAITGASGFVGKNIINELEENNEVLRIERSDLNLSNEDFGKKYDGIDVFINLAGANISTRWNEDYKKILVGSRINTTNKLIESFKLMKNKPKQLISTSAVGIYKGDKEYTEETTEYSNDFLGELCQQWENEAKKAEDLGIKVAITRFGVVIGNGGALSKMLPPFKMGLGGVIGDGKQSFSWIHIKDLVNAQKFLIEQELDGTFNYTAPTPSTNEGLTKALGEALNKSTFIPLPVFMVKLIFSEGATVLLDGQRVISKKLPKAGFEFQFKTIEEAIADVVKK
ncbi:MAG: TIGR01777 family oxidoreductase [Campylobacterales bacterium]|nr:TIGR01777 family oxidoreductase [Campylobacterales bacterium]